jgi:hypothetical protein
LARRRCCFQNAGFFCGSGFEAHPAPRPLHAVDGFGAMMHSKRFQGPIRRGEHLDSTIRLDYDREIAVLFAVLRCLKDFFSVLQ